MFSKSANSMLVALLMTLVIFTGCIEEAEEIEEKLSEEVKCSIIKGEFELLNTEMSGINEEYRKFLTSDYNDTSGKCIITFIVIDDTGALHTNADGTPFVYEGEISGTSDNIAIKLGSNEYTGKLEDSGEITLSNGLLLVPCENCFDDGKLSERIINLNGDGANNPPGNSGGCIDYDDENDNGLYDSGEPCHDNNSEGNNPPGEGQGCIDYDDENDNGLYDSGEPCHDDNTTIERGCTENATELVHDPSSFFIDGDTLIAYTSGSSGRSLQSVSINLADRSYACLPTGVTFFADGAPQWAKEFQAWNPTGEFDAPAQVDNGKFIFYTVYDEDDGEIKDAIGVAENTGTPTNPSWVDRGMVVESYDEASTTPRAMDPAVLSDDDGKLWLIFGSHAGGVYVTELDAETKKLKDKPDVPETTEHSERFTHIAQHMNDEDTESELEAAYIYKNDGYYYLFNNWGGCCNGSSSTYYITMGRSDTITGPYLDKDGGDMANGAGTHFLDAEDRFIGPGHAGITQLEDDSHIFTYHFYDGNDNGVSKLGVRALTWGDDGWPILGEHLVDQPPYSSNNSNDGDDESNGEFILFVGDSDIENWADYVPSNLDDGTYENVGVGGATCDQIADQSQYDLESDLQQYEPTWVILVCGENDLADDETVDDTFEDFEEIIGIIHNAGAKVLYMGTKPEPSTTDLHTSYQEYDDKIREYALWLKDEDEGLLVMIDVYAGFEKLGNPDTLYDEDELHLSSEGYDYWNQWAQNAIDDNGVCVIWKDDVCDESTDEESSETHNVSITDGMDFDPEELTINVGDTVTWTNNDGMSHTATSTSGPVSFNSGNMASGDTWSFTFMEAGTYNYKCDYHSSMTATITVND